jgi:hypothetical protein
MSEGGSASVPEISQELVGRLQAVGRAVSPEEIGDLWIFPPLSDVEESSEFLLFTRHRDGDRRSVYSARVRRDDGEDPGSGAAPGTSRRPSENGGAPGGDGGSGLVSAPQRITHHGTVPRDRVGRLVRRFRRRLGEEDREPVHVTLDGRRDRWTALLGADGEAAGDAPGAEEPRATGPAPAEGERDDDATPLTEAGATGDRGPAAPSREAEAA